MSKIRPFVPPLASSALLFFSFVPEWGFLIAYVALVPLFHSIILRPRVRIVALFGVAFGACYFFWVRVFSPAAPVLMALLHGAWITLGLLPAVCLSRTGRTSMACLLIPAGWIAAEWLRSLGPYGYEWGFAGYTQYGSLPISSFAALGGIWLVSAIVILANLIFTWVILKQKSARWILPVLFSAAVWMFSPAKHLSDDVRAARDFVLVQTKVSPYPPSHEREKQLQEQLAWLANQTNRSRASNIILPETLFSTTITAVSGMLEEEPRMLLSGFLQGPENRLLLVGAIERDERHMYNAAVQIDAQGVRLNSYRKHHLVPFGETIPSLEEYDWAQSLGQALGTPFFSAGNSPAPLSFLDRRAAILVCFEGTFSGLVKKAAKDADLIINISNDAWSESAFGHEQHLRFLRFRAIETGLPVIRVGNSGPTALFAPTGRLVARIPHDGPGVLDLSEY